MREGVGHVPRHECTVAASPVGPWYRGEGAWSVGTCATRGFVAQLTRSGGYRIVTIPGSLLNGVIAQDGGMSHNEMVAPRHEAFGSADTDATFRIDGAVDDEELTTLHQLAFRASGSGFVPWSRRLQRHSICWVTAHQGERLVGFINVIGDGGAHAVLLDTVVEPAYQRRGIGRGLVHRAVEEARTLGCHFLHVDYDQRAADFYERVCGFDPIGAGLIRLA